MRCYLFRRGHIAAVEVLAYGTDHSLIQQARDLFEKRKDEFEGFEVWDRTRLVYRHPVLPPKYTTDTGLVPRSLLYRLKFLSEDRRLLGQYDFPAESDGAAFDIAHLAFDACSDRAISFEVWHGSRLMASEGRPASVTLEQLSASGQAQVAELEERIRDSTWAVASSERLLARLDAVSAKPSAAGQRVTETVVTTPDDTTSGT